VLCFVALGVGVGVVAVSASSNGISVGVALLAAPLLVAFSFLVAKGPKWCLLGLIAAVVFGFSRDSVSLGAIDLRVPDPFLVALAGWVLVLRARDGQRGWIPGRRLLAVWLAALGFSLYPLLVHGTVDAAALVVWLRLVSTFVLVWFVPYAVYRLRDIEFVFGGIAVIVTAALLLTILSALSRGDVGSRLKGAYEANTNGLFAVMLIVLALHGPVPRRPWQRLFLFVIGILGLLMARSVGATAAAVVALGLYGIGSVNARRLDSHRQQLVVPIRLLAMIVIGFAVVLALRPTNLPISPDFGKSTTVHRVVLADAGLELFQRDPLFGVGFGQAPQQVGSPAVNRALRQRFEGSINPGFIPKAGSAPELHNSYIQSLAETGLVGFLLLLGVLIVVGKGIARILRSVRENLQLYVAARAAVILLIVVLVWWNDNTLYGAQPESVLAATFLGILAAVPMVARAERAGVVVEAAA
jgi:hypothetical protein